MIFNKYKLQNIFTCLLLAFGLSACSGVTTINTSQRPSVNPNARWAMLSINNHTEIPLANKRISSITSALLRSKGIHNLRVYHARVSTEDMLLNPNKIIPQSVLIAWARRHHIRYAITGSVNEWRYRAGNDNEPAVGITLELLDIHKGKIVWSVAISDTGMPRQSVSSLAQQLVNVALNGLLGT